MTKMKYKANERRAMKHYGTERLPFGRGKEAAGGNRFSKYGENQYPDPLWNTPENFLRDMIESVQKQTYGNWGCAWRTARMMPMLMWGNLQGSWRGRDERIRYRKLEKNEGIAGNTNQCLTMATGRIYRPV